MKKTERLSPIELMEAFWTKWPEDRVSPENIHVRSTIVIAVRDYVHAVDRTTFQIFCDARPGVILECDFINNKVYFRFSEPISVATTSNFWTMKNAPSRKKVIKILAAEDFTELLFYHHAPVRELISDAMNLRYQNEEAVRRTGVEP